MEMALDALRILILAFLLDRINRRGRACRPALQAMWQPVRAGVILLLFGSAVELLADRLPPGPYALPLWMFEHAVGYLAGLVLVTWGMVRLLDATAELGAANDKAWQREREATRQLTAAMAEDGQAARRIAALEAQLAEAIAAKTRVEEHARANSAFLARMSHELRQPLTTVVGFSDVLRSEVFGPIGNSRYRNYVAGILGASRQLSVRLTDLLDLCSIEAGEMALHEEPIAPRDLVAGCLQMFGQRALQRGCLLDFEVEESLPSLWADARRLKQILANLLDDALDRCGEGAFITVAVCIGADGGVILSVRDPGVAADTVAEGGSRLGRVLAHSLAELHQGRLSWGRGAGGDNEAALWLPRQRVMIDSAAAR